MIASAQNKMPNNSILKKMSVATFLLILLAYILFETTVRIFPTNKVAGMSMIPSLEEGQRYPGTKFWDEIKRLDIFVIDSTNIQQKGLSLREGLYVKRVIGIPGDTLTFDVEKGVLININGKPVSYSPAPQFMAFSMKSKEPMSKGARINEYPFNATYPFSGKNSHFMYKADVEVFASSDEKVRRYTDLVFNYPWLEEQAKGNNFVTLTVPEDKYFLLSDNLPAGADSRHFGFVHKSEFMNKVLNVE